jgi:hypothetical protein
MNTFVKIVGPRIQCSVGAVYVCVICVYYQSIFLPVLLYSSNESRPLGSNVLSFSQYRCVVLGPLPLKSQLN